MADSAARDVGFIHPSRIIARMLARRIILRRIALRVVVCKLAAAVRHNFLLPLVRVIAMHHRHMQHHNAMQQKAHKCHHFLNLHSHKYMDKFSTINEIFLFSATL